MSYLVTSAKAEDFISDEEIRETIDYAAAHANDRSLVESILQKARQCKGLTHREAAVLLECDLRFEDFPEEPIGVGGTLAHALERVPPLVCTRRGYRVRSLTCFPSTYYLPERFQD